MCYIDEEYERELLVGFARELMELEDEELVADRLEEYLSGYLRDIEAAGGFGG